MNNQLKTVIVEDEPGALAALQQMIEEFIPSIDIIGTGENVVSAIEAIKTLQPELVLMDINLPDGDAFDILDKIDTNELNIIFTTAYADFREKAFDYYAVQ